MYTTANTLNILSLSVFLNNLNKMNQRSSSYIHAFIKQVRIMKKTRERLANIQISDGNPNSINHNQITFAQTQYTEGDFQSRDVYHLKYNCLNSQ